MDHSNSDNKSDKDHVGHQMSHPPGRAAGKEEVHTMSHPAGHALEKEGPHRPMMLGAHRHMLEDFRRRFFVSLILTVPILILSPGFQAFFGVSFSFDGSTLILLVLSTAVYFYGGYPFLKGIVQEIQTRLLGMMTLIAVAITVAYVFSAAVVLGVVIGEPFFWELATLIDIMLLGHWVEMRSVLGASQALEELVKIMPSEAHRLKDGWCVGLWRASPVLRTSQTGQRSFSQ